MRMRQPTGVTIPQNQQMFQAAPQMFQHPNVQMASSAAGAPCNIRVKVSFDGDTRIWRCSRLDDVQGLLQFMASSWPSFELIAQYQDIEDELVTIVSDKDLMDAYCVAGYKQSGSVRLFARTRVGNNSSRITPNISGRNTPMKSNSGQGQQHLNNMAQMIHSQPQLMNNQGMAANMVPMGHPMSFAMAPPATPMRMGSFAMTPQMVPMTPQRMNSRPMMNNFVMTPQSISMAQQRMNSGPMMNNLGMTPKMAPQPIMKTPLALQSNAEGNPITGQRSKHPVDRNINRVAPPTVPNQAPAQSAVGNKLVFSLNNKGSGPNVMAQQSLLNRGQKSNTKLSLSRNSDAVKSKVPLFGMVRQNEPNKAQHGDPSLSAMAGKHRQSPKDQRSLSIKDIKEMSDDEKEQVKTSIVALPRSIEKLPMQKEPPSYSRPNYCKGRFVAQNGNDSKLKSPQIQGVVRNGNPLTANPQTANPLTANPLTANPLTANPLTANIGKSKRAPKFNPLTWKAASASNSETNPESDPSSKENAANAKNGNIQDVPAFGARAGGNPLGIGTGTTSSLFKNRGSGSSASAQKLLLNQSGHSGAANSTMPLFGMIPQNEANKAKHGDPLLSSTGSSNLNFNVSMSLMRKRSQSQIARSKTMSTFPRMKAPRQTKDSGEEGKVKGQKGGAALIPSISNLMKSSSNKQDAEERMKSLMSLNFSRPRPSINRSVSVMSTAM